MRRRPHRSPASPPRYARLRAVRLLGLPFALACAVLALPPLARAEKTDREKPIFYQGDTGGANLSSNDGDSRRSYCVPSEPGQLAVGDGVRQPGELSRKARRRRRILRRLRTASGVRRTEAPARAVRPCVAQEKRRRDPQQLHLLQRRNRGVQGGGTPRLAGSRSG